VYISPLGNVVPGIRALPNAVVVARVIAKETTARIAVTFVEYCCVVTNFLLTSVGMLRGIKLVKTDTGENIEQISPIRFSF
jgi:hypothetical protein